METTIEQTIIKTIEEAETDNAVYNLEVQQKDGELVAVSAQVRGEERKTGTDGIVNVSVKSKGVISYSSGKVSFSGFSLDDKLATYVTEFNEIVEHIKERIG